ncbi:hypothetical protein HK405_003836 [Cladochytrium tenue]|nr:hypothetical protein HK405_003836 [Cladochytrium tenue]
MKDVTFLNDGNSGTRAANVATPSSRPASMVGPGVSIDDRSSAMGSTGQSRSGSLAPSRTSEAVTGATAAADSSAASVSNSDAASVVMSTAVAGSTLTSASSVASATHPSRSPQSAQGVPAGVHAAAPAPATLINFDKYRSIVQLLARYITAATEPYDFGPLLQPVLRGLPVCAGSPPVGPGGGGMSAVAVATAPLPHRAGAAPGVWPLLPPLSSADAGGTPGLAYAEGLALVVETRLAGAFDDKSLSVAWEWAAVVDADEA